MVGFSQAFHSEIGDPNFGLPEYGLYDACFDFEPDGDVDFADLYIIRQLYSGAFPAVPLTGPELASAPTTVPTTDPAGSAANGSDISSSPDADTDSHGITAIALAVSSECTQLTCLPLPGGTGAGVIRGTKWQDLNGDGRRTDDEPPLPGVLIYLDLNNNGKRDVFRIVTSSAILNLSEPFDITDQNGQYEFTELPANDYMVREEVPTGFVQTFPTNHWLANSFGNHQIFEFHAQTGDADQLRIANMTNGLAGVSVSPWDHRVYGVSATGELLVIEELRGATHKVGQLSSDVLIALVPADPGEGDLDFDPTSVDAAAGDHVADIYFVGGVNARFEDRIYRATLDYTACVNQPLGCLPALSHVQVVTVIEDAIDLSAMAFNAQGQLFVFDSGNSDRPGRILELDKSTGAVIQTINVQLPSPRVQFAGMDFGPDGALRVVFSDGQVDWTMSVDLTVKPAAVDIKSVATNLGMAGLEHVQTTGHWVFINGQDIARGVDFGNQPQHGEIHGFKWIDVNGNGVRDPEDVGLLGWTIYLDLNNNGTLDENEPFEITGQRGEYWFMDLPAGSYRVAEVPQQGWTQTYPDSGSYTIDVTAGQRVVDINFGNTRGGEIHGFKWLDENGNGRWDDNEPGLPGWQIYLDLNNNRQLDPNEPSTITDERGGYWFMDLPPGTYTVGEVLQSGWEQTYPGSQPSLNVFQFEDVPPDHLYHVQDVFSTTADQGMVASIEVRPFVYLDGQTTADGSTHARLFTNDPVNHVIDINNVNLDFTFSDVVTGIYLPFSESGGNVNLWVNDQLANVANFANLNGQTLGGVTIEVTQLTDSIGVLRLTGDINQFAIGGQELWIDNLVVFGGLVPGTGVHIVELGSGDVQEGRNFGNRPTKGAIHGSKFIDFDGDGVRGPNDRGILGWTIYLDLNNNGQWDPNEPTTQTNRTGEYWFMDLEPGTYVVRELQEDGFTQTAPRATFTGTDYDFGLSPRAIAAGDLDGDHAPELVIADALEQVVYIGHNTGDGTFVAGATLPVNGQPVDVRLGDLDGDGDLDLVVSTVETSQMIAFLNEAGSFAAPVSYALSNAPTDFELGDFNNDGYLDILISSTSAGGLAIMLNKQDGTFGTPNTVLAATGPADVEVADFDHDGDLDVAFIDVFDHAIIVAAHTDSNQFDPIAKISIEGDLDDLVVSDFNQDGNFDLAVSSQTSSGVAVFFGLSSATEVTFTEDAEFVVSIDTPVDLIAGDVDGDGYPDLIVGDRESDTIEIYFGGAEHSLQGPLSESIDRHPVNLVAADFNQDGRLDLATSTTQANGAVVLLQGPRDAYVVNLEDGEQVFGRDFGNFRNGRIEGTKFHDQDCQGDRDASEPGLPGFTIYVDLNDDGVLNPGEPFAITDADGNYTIDNLAPGTYSVREMVPDDYALSYPVTGRYVITIGQSNQLISNLDFGNFMHTPLPDGIDWMYGMNGNDILYGDNLVVNPCILSLGDDDHLFGMAGDDRLVGQLRNDTYHFGPAPAAGDETDVIEELEDGGTNERWDEGIYDRLDFSTIVEKDFTGLGADEPVIADLSGASPTFTQPNEIAEHQRVGSGTHYVVTGAADQYQFIEQLVGGDADDILVGNERDNLLDGRAGSDIMQGAAGDDTYVFITGNPGDNDQLVETIGSDTLDFHLIPDAVTVDLSTPPLLTTAPVVATWGAPQQTVESATPGLFENVIGTVQADTLRGSDEDNILIGLQDDDRFQGLGGNDSLLGGPGNDSYEFADGFGNDVVVELLNEGTADVLDFTLVTTPLTITIGSDISATDGANTVFHDGLNIEQLIGGSGNDTLISGDGDNIWIIDGLNTGTLNGVAFTGIENLQGGIGNDMFIFLPGGSLSGSIDAGAGNDTFDFRQGGSVAGTLIGSLDDDTLIGDDLNRTWTISGINSGNASGIGNFTDIENLTGGAGIDTFTLLGGTLSGRLTGGDNSDELQADNVATTFTLTGDDVGVATGVGEFIEIENLTGNAQNDRFELNLGSLSGNVVGNGGDDTLVAADVPTIFTVTGADSGTATNLGSYSAIANLAGNQRSDTFILLGGTQSGTIDGADGEDTLIGDNVVNAFVVTGVNAGTAVGVNGFANVENLTGNQQNDTLTLAGGTLSGTFDGGDGVDRVTADNVANFFGTTGPNVGFVTGLGQFARVEELYGNAQDDAFLFFGVPFAGDIVGNGGNDSIQAFGIGLTFQVTGADSGNVDGTTTFTGIANLLGGFADDRYEMLGGTLSGGVSDVFGGNDSLFGGDAANNWQLSGADSGTLVGITTFAGIETLEGGNQADQFEVGLGASITSAIIGGDGSDTMIAPPQFFNVFQVDETDGGLLWTFGRFQQIENLVGNAFSDLFWFTGGTLTGSIDGQAGSNLLQGDNVAQQFVIDGVDSGQFSGVAGGFANIGTLAGGNAVDEFEMTETGSVSGQILGGDGDDLFKLTPAAGSATTVNGGLGLDELTIDAQAGVPAEVLNTVTIVPGGATVTFDGIEQLLLTCDTCAPLPSVIATPEVESGGPRHARRRGADIADLPDSLTSAFVQLAAAAPRRAATLSAVDVGAFDSSDGVRMGFVDMALAQLHRDTARRQRRFVDDAFGTDENWLGW
ncbi:MAG: VCBS repeat-containing protein [Planctomycetales bacterium]|nr:VCBS repeat-containing protein [Planctomycetales bacterium]